MKRISLFAFTCILFINGNAQLLWQISGNRLKEPSFLFGTHPLIPASYLDSIPGIYKAFNSSKTVVSELMLNTIDASSHMQNSVILPDGKTLFDIYNAEEIELLNEQLKRVLRLELRDLGMLQPHVILQFYKTEISKRAANTTSDLFTDSYFQLIANSKNKKIVGLQSGNEDWNNSQQTSEIDNQARLLFDILAKSNKLEDEIRKLHSIYLSGNLDSLTIFDFNTTNTLTNNNTDTQLNSIRQNTEWVSILPELMHDKSCFIAVSATHLPGSNGLIQLLRTAGYKIQPVK